MEPKETCAICLGTLNAGERQALFTAECSHTFHFRCIASNVQYGNHICPTCRSTWTNLPTQFSPASPTLTHVRVPALTTLSFADDEPLPSPAPATPATASSSTPLCPQTEGNMTVKALPEYPALSKPFQSNSFPVLIAIQAPPLSPEASDRPSDRAPLDLVAVLDVSGSMHGDKIRLVKQAIGFVVANLGPTDRLSVITFANSARRVTPLRRMTDAGRSDTARAVNSLRANGNTNIIAGLKMAVEVLEQRREKNPVSSIILLSDGQDNQNGYGSDFLHSLQNLPICLRANDTMTNAQQSDAIPVHTFGFGEHHDATALHAIADGSGGTFSYIESIEIIQDAFARCIGGLLSVVAQGVEILVKTGSPGVQIQSIPSGRYRNSIDSDRKQGVIYVGDVYAEEEKKFLVYLSVPPADEETLTTKLFEVNCSYKDPLSNQNIMSDVVSVEIRRPLTEDLSEEDRQVCLEVDRERNRISIAEGISEAQDMAERGELSGAQAMLLRRRVSLMESPSAQAGDALCGRLDSEVRDIHERMSSRLAYEGGGRAYALSRTSAHMYQRASTQAVRSHLGRDASLFSAPLSSSSARPFQCTSSLVRVAACSAPVEEMEYQTSFMRKMVQKSHELRQSGDQDEKCADNRNTSNP